MTNLTGFKYFSSTTTVNNKKNLQTKLYNEVIKFKEASPEFISKSKTRQLFNQAFINYENELDPKLKTINPDFKATFILNNFFNISNKWNIPINDLLKFNLIYLLTSISEQIDILYRNNTLPIIIGVQGHQGSGKSTVTSLLKTIINLMYDYNVGCISIDDLYLTYNELEKLKREDPRYKYRGPPGTHDVVLSKQILNYVKERRTGYEIPVYDKTLYNGKGDRKEHGIKQNKPIDILIYEGWFLGSDSVTEEELMKFPNKDHEFLSKINNNLKSYESLWNLLDMFIVLRPEKYEYSKMWRIEAEEKMIKETGKGLTSQQINEFVDYFWDTVPPYLYFENIEKKRKPFLTLNMDKTRTINY